MSENSTKAFRVNGMTSAKHGIEPANNGLAPADGGPNRVENWITPVEDWLQRVVIGLNLCPFASRPTRAGLVRMTVSEARDEETLLEDLQRELERLESCAATELETTVLIIPHLLGDFYDYNLFLNWVDQLIARRGWEGEFQVATFHPQYQFEGTAPDDPENLTNRSPYPVLHLLREDSLEQMLDRYPDSDAIPEANIRRMNELSDVEKQQLFPFLALP